MRSRSKKIGAAAGLVLLVLLAGVAGLWWWTGRRGATELEGWILAYLQRAIQEQINPQLKIGALDYRRPKTVVISDLELRQDDVVLLSAARLRLELAELPRRGEPVVIERIDLTAPVVRLVTAPDGRFAGWSGLVKQKVIEDPDSAPAGYRLSDFLRIRHATIDEGSVSYLEAGSEEPMVLKGIGVELETPPDAEAPGWYQIAGKLARDRLFDIALDARLNLDTGELRINRMLCQAAVDRSSYEIFPPQVQSVLRARQLEGDLKLEVAGALPLGETGDLRLAASADLGQLRLIHAGRLAEAQNVWIDADLDRDNLQARVRAQALGGGIEGSGTLALAQNRLLRWDARLDRVDVPKLLTFAPPGVRAWVAEAPPGKLSGQVGGAMHNFEPRTLEANGQISIDPLPLTVGESRLELRALAAKGQVQGGALTLDAQVQAADGQVETRATYDLVGARPATVSCALRGISVGSVLAATGPAALRDMAAQGRLAATFNGELSATIPPARWIGAEARLAGDFQNAYWKPAHAPMSLEGAEVQASLAGGTLGWKARTSTFGGRAELAGSLGLAGERPLNLNWRVDELRLQDIVGHASGAGGSRYRGRVSGGGTLAAQLSHWPGSLTGEGLVEVNRGELIRMPVLADVAHFLNPRIPLFKATSDRDHGRADFELASDRVGLRSFEVSCALLSVSGQGEVFYDKRLNLVVHASPLAGIESRLGPLAGLTQKLSDRLVTYRVEGHVQSPKVRVEPLGLDLSR